MSKTSALWVELMTFAFSTAFVYIRCSIVRKQSERTKVFIAQVRPAAMPLLTGKFTETQLQEDLFNVDAM